MSEKYKMKSGKNPMQKPKITENTKINNTLGKFMKDMENAPLKRNEFSQIRQYLQDALIKKHSKMK